MTRAVRGGRPLRTTHPLPEDVPGAVVDGCGIAPEPGEGTTAAAPADPAAASQAVILP